MSIARLTERKLRDARFRKTEDAILDVFFEEDGMKLSVVELAQKIGVNRTTIHRHHRAMYEMVEDYEKYILKEYENLIYMIRKRGNVGLRRLYYEMIMFILKNRRVFTMLISRRKLRVIEEMILALRLDMGLLCSSERVVRVYTGEIVGLIADWGIEGFREVEMVKLLNNIMYLTEVAKERLMILDN